MFLQLHNKLYVTLHNGSLRAFVYIGISIKTSNSYVNNYCSHMATLCIPLAFFSPNVASMKLFSFITKCSSEIAKAKDVQVKID